MDGRVAQVMDFVAPAVFILFRPCVRYTYTLLYAFIRPAPFVEPVTFARSQLWLAPLPGPHIDFQRFPDASRPPITASNKDRTDSSTVCILPNSVRTAPRAILEKHRADNTDSKRRRAVCKMQVRPLSACNRFTRGLWHFKLRSLGGFSSIFLVPFFVVAPSSSLWLSAANGPTACTVQA